MSGYSRELGITNKDWDAIKGSNPHAAMVMNRVRFRDEPGVIQQSRATVLEWLENNCSRSFYFASVEQAVYFLSRHDLTMFLLAHS